ncbi:MAG: F0F1 ATP synthase subunit delta, partial [Alphaproteobacteria bacterium]
MIAESDDLRALIRSPVVGRAQQARAIDAVVERAGLSALTRQFVGVAAGNRRLFVLPQIIQAFRQLVARHRGEQTADVTSATPLTDAQLDQIQGALRRAVGSEVAVEYRVDPSLLGGLIVRVGSRMVDSSLKTKLQSLQLAMKGAR